MYLKSLDIHGFKSFADKTTFVFSTGVTGIVGPNGCGKSNVVDAIRWVLGETSAKALRGGEMADVIFNGTEKRKPLGMAEVTLTMADCEQALKVDFNEVSITRRVYRDGKSEYRINQTLCRLKDIHDLFMDTGIGRTAYSIMAQGQIDQILSSKPEERRTVFEEAAGITKYKREKKEAMRKLEYTEANLLRVSDVLAEQERRMNALRRQVAKARRFQALSRDVRVLDGHWSHRKYVELTNELTQLKVALRRWDVLETEQEQQLPSREEAVAEARAEARRFESELSELRQRMNEHRNAMNASEARVAFNLERATELESRIRQNRDDVDQTRQKLSQQEDDFQQANQELERLTRRLIDQEHELGLNEERSLAARSRRELMDQQLRELRTAASRCQTQIATAQAKIESAVSQLEGSRVRSRQLMEEEQRLRLTREESQAVEQQLREQAERLQADLVVLAEQNQAAERAVQNSQVELEHSRKVLAEAQRMFDQKESRHEVVKRMVESGEGYAKGTQTVLAAEGELAAYRDQLGLVFARHLDVEAGSARAIEAVLGEHLQAVLIEESSAALQILLKLAQNQWGKVSLMPLNFLSPSQAMQREVLPEGAIAWAIDHVRADAQVAGLVQQLLDRVLIVPDLLAALKLRQQWTGLTYVTLQGELILPHGLMHGGQASGGNESLLARQQEVRDLAEQIERAGVELAQLVDQVSEQEKLCAERRESFEVLRERMQQHKVEISNLQGQWSLARREVEALDTKIDNVCWERNELQQHENTAAESRLSQEAELIEFQQQWQEMELQQRAGSSELESVMREEAEWMAVLQELRMALAVDRQAKTLMEEQQRPMERRLQELRELAMRREAEIEQFLQRIELARAENASLAEQVEYHRAEVDDLLVEIEQQSGRRASIIEQIDVAEKALSELRRQIARIAEQRGKDEVTATKLELRLEHLVTATRERHQIELADFRPDADAFFLCLSQQRMRKGGSSSEFAGSEEEPEEEINDDHTPETSAAWGSLEQASESDWRYVEQLVADLKRRLDSMGPVNVDAIQEFEELEERFNFMRSEHDDLVKAKTELLGIIERINEETQRRFSETFAQVRENFKIMFQELFGETGKADLLLVDESDPLETGIEVIAKPPGKKLQSISLLSGGERSMTAVALLFSIYMIKPSPFCVLDELDAPLDESNISRFVKVLDRFIDNSQFIIVTHSKRTMARADVMYGVTMEEFGVSKPVGMRLTSAEEGTMSKSEKSDPQTAAQKAAMRLDA